MTILTTNPIGHIPVLYNEILEYISLFEDRQNIVVDATLGLGGHANGIISRLNNNDIFIGFDSDIDNLNQAKINIETKNGDNIKNKNIKIFYINSNFRLINEKLAEIGIDKITHIYYDFGVNSVHYDNSEKGFSFRFDGPLDLRFDRNTPPSAADIVNNYSEAELRKILYSYGEEPKTNFIVKEILSSRQNKKIITTFDLVDIITKSSFDPKSKVRVFQALRIEVNDEFGSIKESLNKVINIIDKDGIIACITFHSLEDKITKEIFVELCREEINELTGQTQKKGLAKKITKKPITPTEKEILDNPRSRSAKLRVVQKN